MINNLRINFEFFQKSKIKDKISLEEKRRFYYMLKFYMNTKMSIINIFDLIYDDIKLYNIIEIKKYIKNGISLAETLEKFNFTDEFIYACLNVGENTGDYRLALNKIVDYIDNRIKDKKYYTQVISYPLFLILFANAVLVFLVFFIVPQLYNTLLVVEAEIPFSIKILYNLSYFIKSNFLIGLLFVIISIYLIIKNKNDKRIIKIKEKIFGFKIIKYIYNVHILKTLFWQLSILHNYGIDLISAIKIIEKTIKSKNYSKILSDISKDLQTGYSLSECLNKHKNFFPRAVLEYIKLGEDTATLDENFEKTVEFLEIKANDFSVYFKQLAQPVLIIFIGFFVFAVLIFIIPMIDAITSLGGF